MRPIRAADLGLRITRKPGRAAAAAPAGLGNIPTALGRLATGEMNGTEAAYAAELELQRRGGAVAWYRFEAMRLRLAPNTFLVPDFAVMLADGRFQIHEVKGAWTDDALAKTKIAAALFPFEFFIVRKLAKKDGGGFSIESLDRGNHG